MKLDDRLSVLVIGRFAEETFALHISETLAAMGHDVVRFEAGFGGKPAAGGLRWRLNGARRALEGMRRSLPALVQRRTVRLVRRVAERKIDLILVCHDFLLPAEVDALKSATGAPVALWFPDAIINFGRSYFLNARYDGLFFKDPYIVHRLRATLGRAVYYLPECFNPARHYPLGLTSEDLRTYGCDVATAGSIHPYRARFFAALGDHDVKIWGSPPPLWMDTGSIDAMLQHRYVSYEEKTRAFLGAKIVVNNLHPAEIWGINCRAFEIAGVGAFQLIDWRPGLGQLFDDGTEVVSFHSISDLREKIRYYLDRPWQRSEIARRGMERARREHTYSARLSLLLKTIAGEGAAFPLPELEPRPTPTANVPVGTDDVETLLGVG